MQSAYLFVVLDILDVPCAYSFVVNYFLDIPCAYVLVANDILDVTCGDIDVPYVGIISASCLVLFACQLCNYDVTYNVGVVA